MERETLLTMLVMIFGGCALQALACWPDPLSSTADAVALERAAWLRVCLPALPMLLIAAWLAGWALTQPDPVRVPLDPLVVVALWLPFGLLLLRALLRALWALLREPPECAVATVGLIAPQIMFSPLKGSCCRLVPPGYCTSVTTITSYLVHSTMADLLNES